MKRCYGCFEQIADDQKRCPVCGYMEGISSSDPVYLVPGTLLSGRYTLGTVIETDDSTVTYAAWDNASSIKVKIKEFLPTKLITRVPGSTFVVPFDDNRDALFDNGFKAFVNEANRIYEHGGAERLYDCIGENNTAYMIFEWTGKKADSPFKAAPAAPVAAPAPAPAAAKVPAPAAKPAAAPVFAPAQRPAAPAAKENPAFRNDAPKAEPVGTARPGYRNSTPPAPVSAPAVQNKNNEGFLQRLPLWVKIAVPVALVAVIAVPIIIATSVSKNKKQSGTEQKPVTETSGTAAETTVTETEITETTPVSETTEETLPATGWQGSDWGGWRYYLAADVYYHDSWEEIGGEWYYFNSEGIMESRCYRDGYWIAEDGTRDSDTPNGEWKEDDNGEWFEDAGWYPSNMGLWIDGEYYWFGSDGYWDDSVSSPEEAAALAEADEDDEDGDDEE